MHDDIENRSIPENSQKVPTCTLKLDNFMVIPQLKWLYHFGFTPVKFLEDFHVLGGKMKGTVGITVIRKGPVACSSTGTMWVHLPGTMWVHLPSTMWVHLRKGPSTDLDLSRPRVNRQESQPKTLSGTSIENFTS